MSRGEFGAFGLVGGIGSVIGEGDRLRNVAAPPRVSTPLTQIGDSMEAAAELSRRVRNVVDRLIGSAPETDTPTMGLSGGDGALPNLADKAEVLRRFLSEANSALDRVERVLS